MNQLQRDGDKTWDLGWVYTVIAGVLNVLVIYDALAGPAFRETKGSPQPEGPAGASEHLLAPADHDRGREPGLQRHPPRPLGPHPEEAWHWGFRMTSFLLTIGVILFALSTFL